MLLPINMTSCHPALSAAKNIQVQLVQWLCDPARSAADITQTNLRTVPNDQIVGNWLAGFSKRTHDKTALKHCMEQIADADQASKTAICIWMHNANDIVGHFQPTPPQNALPLQPACGDPIWTALRKLLDAFYEIGLREGLPYDVNGQPIAVGGVTRQKFIELFKSENSEQVCPFCDGYLNGIQVDHWIIKAKYPNLSVSPENLTPVCWRCNSRAVKGESLTMDKLSPQAPFQVWFHPYLRQAHDKITPTYADGKVSVTASSQTYLNHVSNLDGLLKLTKRWTEEFNLYFKNRKRHLLDKVRRGRIQRTVESVHDEVNEWIAELEAQDRNEPFYLVRRMLLDQVLDPPRLQEWVDELGNV